MTQKLLYPKLSYVIRGACFELYKELGSGHKETIYHRGLIEKLKAQNLNVSSETQITIRVEGKKIGSYVPDLVINDKVILELKAKPFLVKQDVYQFWQYLKVTKITHMKCPFCSGTKIIKKGTRRKKLETIQLYYCRHCQKKFTPLLSRGKTYPLKIIIDSLTLYNRCLGLEQSARLVSQKYGLKISPQNISNWLKDFGQYLPFLRLRQFIAKKYPAREILVETKLFHGQIYDFKYHRAKTDLILDEHFKHYKFRPLQEFLELVYAECPHQVFRETEWRASEYKGIFNLDKVRVTPKKNNLAVINTRFVLQAVANNKLRHQTLQEFMLVNDSVTVATEVPVLLDEDDLRHYRDELGFAVPDALFNNQFSSTNPSINTQDCPERSQTDNFQAPNSHESNIENSLKIRKLKIENSVITGHIDFLQIRNGSVHILDYKPSARKVRPVDQLTIYALALSRLTGLRLFHFKCAWFDEEDYFEFFPLHVVYKKKKSKVKSQMSNVHVKC